MNRSTDNTIARIEQAIRAKDAMNIGSVVACVQIADLRTLLSTAQQTEELREAAIKARSALKLAYDMHRRARNTIPDDEEGLAAQVFCHHINHADSPMIEALAYIDEALAHTVEIKPEQ